MPGRRDYFGGRLDADRFQTAAAAAQAAVYESAAATAAAQAGRGFVSAGGAPRSKTGPRKEGVRLVSSTNQKSTGTPPQKENQTS